MTDLHNRTTSPAEPGIEPNSGEGSTDEMVAQRGLFAGPVLEVPVELYAEVLAGQVVRHRRSLRVEPYSRAGTNTYFGRFPASFWQRWTTVPEVTVRGRAEGAGRVLLRASNVDAEPHTVAVHEAPRGEFALTARLDRFLDGGGLWLEAETDDATLTLSEVRWTVDGAVPRTTEIVICTFNRVDDCLATLQALGDEPDVMEVVGRVTVVDQGDDALEDRAAFAGVADHLGGRLRYLRQANLGGAGGFTRGLHEAQKAAGDAADGTDVLLMDDDVRLEPEIVVRLSAFARCTTRPTVVGGQMLNLMRPHRLLAGAEHIVFGELGMGRPVGGAPSDADVTAPLSDGTVDVADDTEERKLARRLYRQTRRQDRRVEAAYTGWWACLIPAEVTRGIGYPLPLFFQWDDVEYGLRAWRRGFPVVTLPGAALWHADFAAKDFDNWPRYFDFRNAMITAAVHSEFRTRAVASEIADRLAEYAVALNYGLAAMLVGAVESFLAGPSELDDGGTSTIARAQALRRPHPETTTRAPADIPDSAVAVGVVAPGPPPTHPRVVKVRRLLAHARGRLKMHDGLVGANESPWWHTSRFAQVVVTDASQAGVRLRRHDPDSFRAVGRDGARVLWRLLREGDEAAERWRVAFPHLTSAENWERLFDGAARD